MSVDLTAAQPHMWACEWPPWHAEGASKACGSMNAHSLCPYVTSSRGLQAWLDEQVCAVATQFWVPARRASKRGGF